MFGPRIQQYARRLAEMIVRPLAAIGMTPNMATLLGLVLNGVTAAVLASGHLRLGGAMLLIAGLFDMVDGALARVRNQKTTFGAFFDSTLDRYSEGLVLLGVILFALRLPAVPERTWIVALAYVTALSSLMVSYARARAEGLGLSEKGGLMARPERVVVLVAGLIIGGEALLVWTLGILAVTSTFTAVQRIVSVWRRLAHAPAAEASPSAGAGGVARADAVAAANTRRTGREGQGETVTPPGASAGAANGTGNTRGSRPSPRTIPTERPAQR
ncbi:MAG TPA: CDP-alcohol phosphatidyltransferase family protein [Ktedonobacterales bacterium]|jgi:CDP-diacylglycerol--glycerol-3-phosphate 3-phosphatidyltransferase|nr:CDP-alcohol phosphatidyltransferase family protein [Ktedonobacterales bacterium]